MTEVKHQAPKGWQEREQELTSRFTNIVNVLQAEILRLRSVKEPASIMTKISTSIPSTQASPTVVPKATATTIDQLVQGLLSIPDLKEKIWKKLEQELIEEPLTTMYWKSDIT